MKKLILASLFAIGTINGNSSLPVDSKYINRMLEQYKEYKAIDKNDLNIILKLIDSKKVKPEILRYYDEDTRQAIRDLAAYFNVPTEWFYKLFYYETRLNPKAVNPLNGASGMIQFIPSTAKNLGISVKEIRNMSIKRQLVYVRRFLEKLNPSKHFDSFEDLYMVVFLPAGINKPDSYILGSSISDAFIKKIANQNPAINRNGDGVIDKGEFNTYCNNIHKTFDKIITKDNENKS